MYNEQNLISFSQLYFHGDDIPIVCDYSELLNHYSNFLALFLNNEIPDYKDFFFLDLVVSGFEYCLDLFFSKPDYIDYPVYGEEMVKQFNNLKARETDDFSSDEMILIMSLSCAGKLLWSSYTNKNEIVAKVLDNCYRVSSILSDVNDTQKRRM